MSLRFLLKFAALASTCWISVGAALAESRIALVIGNSDYTSVSALPNPINDARAVTRFLSSAGFEVVQAPNLTQNDMRRTVADFTRMAAAKGPDTVALVFYAGHGVQVDGENFLIPVDARIEREADVPLQAMRLADVMNALSSIQSKSSIVILDACRNNPFSAINKTAGRGLAMVDAPRGSLVSYSTAPGTEAVDGDGANSPFTTALIEIGQEPGLPIEQALKRVRLAVSKATDPTQVPYESSSLTTEFAFFPAQAGQERPTPVKAGGPSSSATSGSESRSVDAWKRELRSKSPRDAYDIVIREDKVEGYQAYLALHSSQPTAPVVRTILVRRQVMIAWYTAVTINTAASYQAFLASYGSSDFATTANRLLERTLARSVSSAGSAFATAATCPCSQPSSPLPRQKRTDLPRGNAASVPTVPAAANVVTNNPPTVVTNNPPTVVVNNPPTVVYTDPAPPIVVVPRRPPIVYVPRPPKGHDKPTGGNDRPTGGTDKPTGGTDKPAGNDKPAGSDKPPGRDKPKSTGGWTVDKPKVTLGTVDKPKVTLGTTDTSRVRLNQGVTSHISSSRNIKQSSSPSFGAATSMSPATGMKASSSFKQQSFGSPAMSRSPSFGQMGGGAGRSMSFGRMGIR